MKLHLFHSAKTEILPVETVSPSMYRYHKLLARHRRELQVAGEIRAIALCVSVAVVLFMGSLLFYSFHTEAASEEVTQQTKYKYYQSVVVDRENALDDIAGRYADAGYYRNRQEYIDEVVEINHLTVTDGHVTNCAPGTRLIVPYYDTRFIQ